MINKAIAFGNLVHENQTRKGTDIPYILHPLEAGIIVSQIKYDKDLICAAILHDTVEDANVTYCTIEKMFNQRVSDLVRSQSEDKTKSWKERKQHTIEYLNSEADDDIKIVCLGDKLSNIRSLYRDYNILKEELWQRFNVKEKEKHGWYYKGLLKGLESLSEYRKYQEFNNLVFNVFGE